MSSTSVGFAIISVVSFSLEAGFCDDVDVPFFNVSELLLLVTGSSTWFTFVDAVAWFEAGNDEAIVETEGPLLSRPSSGFGAGFPRPFPDEAKES